MWIAATPSATQHYVCHDALRQDLISKPESKKIEFLYNTAFHCKLLNYFPSFRLVVQFANSCCMLLHISGSEKLVMTIKWPTLRCIRGESICICGTFRVSDSIVPGDLTGEYPMKLQFCMGDIISYHHG